MCRPSRDLSRVGHVLIAGKTLEGSVLRWRTKSRAIDSCYGVALQLSRPCESSEKGRIWNR